MKKSQVEASAGNLTILKTTRLKEEQHDKMSDGKELTYKEVADHTSKKDLFIVVHDEVFNASSFVDEHPYVGGPYKDLYTGADLSSRDREIC